MTVSVQRGTNIAQKEHTCTRLLEEGDYWCNLSELATAVGPFLDTTCDVAGGARTGSGRGSARRHVQYVTSTSS